VGAMAGGVAKGHEATYQLVVGLITRKDTGICGGLSSKQIYV